MDWHGFLLGIQAGALSTWLRESPSLFGFPTVLIIHAVGMGFLVGTCIAVNLRVLGFASAIPLTSLIEMVPVMRTGFWMNATSGLLLLLAFPIKNFSNPVFFLKLSLIALALINTSLVLKHVRRETNGGKLLAGICLLLWIGAVVSGRLLFYTYPHLNSEGEPF